MTNVDTILIPIHPWIYNAIINQYLNAIVIENSMLNDPVEQTGQTGGITLTKARKGGRERGGR